MTDRAAAVPHALGDHSNLLGSANAGLGAVVRMQVEMSRGDRSRRGADGRLVAWSPIGLPFNYGSIPGTLAQDGQEVDAILVGPRVPVGEVVEAPVAGIVGFRDAGGDDPKVVCGVPTAWDRRVIVVFFTVYATVKTLLGDRSRFDGVRWAP